MPVENPRSEASVELYDEAHRARILDPGAKRYFRILCEDPATGRTREISGGRTRDEARRTAADPPNDVRKSKRTSRS